MQIIKFASRMCPTGGFVNLACFEQGVKSRECVGNPPTKKRSSEVEFSRNELRRFCNEEITVHRQPDHGGIEAS